MRWDFARGSTVEESDPDLVRCLPDFLALPRQGPVAARSFALRWGVPGVCWDPAHADGWHPRVSTLAGLVLPPWRPPGWAKPPKPPGPPADDRQSGIAPLVWWHDVARRLESLIRLHADLAAGHRGDEAAWTTVWGLSMTDDPAWVDNSLDDRREFAQRLMAYWTSASHLAYAPPSWDTGGKRVPGLLPRLTGVDSVLIVGTTKAIHQGERPIVCSACDRTFLRKRRRPRDGEMAFCNRHDRLDRMRLSQRARRESMTDEERTEERRRNAARERRRRKESRDDTTCT